MFKILNQNLREIKDGIVNLITGGELSSSQKSFINSAKNQTQKPDDRFKTLNTFILYQDVDMLSSTAGGALPGPGRGLGV